MKIVVKMLNKMKETTNYILIINLAYENNKISYKTIEITSGNTDTDKPNNSFIIHSDKSFVMVNLETQIPGTKRLH